MAIGLKVEVSGLAGHGDEIERIFLEMAEHVRRTEPGCLRYDVGRSRDQRDDFVVWEIYVDQDAFDGHRVTAHFERLMNGQLPAVVGNRQRATFDIIT
jgi:quinol monooxygenase YgiN